MSEAVKCPRCGLAYAMTPEQQAQYRGATITCSKCGLPFVLGQAAPLPVNPVEYASPVRAVPNPLAVWSVVLGALFFIPVLGFFTGVAAIITGAIGRGKTRDGVTGGKTLATVGLSLGILGVCVGLLLGGLVLVSIPAMGSSRELANRIKCASNMRQIGLAMLLYANENKGAYPPRLQDLVLTQQISAECFVCPSSNDTKAAGNTPAQVAANMPAGTHISYIYLGKGLIDGADPETVVLYEKPGNHGQDGMNFLFADGHVEFLNAQQAGVMLSQLQAGQNPPKIK